MMNSDPPLHSVHQGGPQRHGGYEPEPSDNALLPPSQVTSPVTPPRSRKHMWFGLGGLAIGFLLGAGLVGGIAGINSLAVANAQAAKAGLLADAYETCTLDSVDGATLSADKMSVDFSGAGKYFGPDITDVHCLGDALGMPDSVSSRMGQTRALDGTQSADWDSFTVSWNYHPDDGLGAIFEYVPKP